MTQFRVGVEARWTETKFTEGATCGRLKTKWTFRTFQLSWTFRYYFIYKKIKNKIKFFEAPRGTLIHHYEVDREGIITRNNMIIATEHNNIAYNMAVTQVAKKYVKARKLQEGMLNRVEAVIRAFDPCLSCATHAVGEMPLDIKLVDADGRLVDRKVR